MEERLPLRGLGYVGVTAPDPKAWRDFGTEVCGLAPSPIPPGPRSGGLVPQRSAEGMAADGTLYLKLDDRQWRLAVHPGEPGLAYLGLEVAELGDVGRAAERLAAGGVDVREGSDEERATRGVEALAVLRDPAGHRIELFSGAVRDEDLVSPHGAEFLTGGLGMGHAVLMVPELESALSFYRDTLGFRRTDYMTFGPEASIHFLRCTPRHHSVALLALGGPSGLQHLMFEMRSLDQVGKALDRAVKHGVSISSSLGRHRNDQTVSFYMHGPSGFDIEIGWDGVLVGDDWVEHEFTGEGDEWGHHGLTAESMHPDPSE